MLPWLSRLNSYTPYSLPSRNINSPIFVFIIGQATNYVNNRHHHEIIKTNIGEFVLREGKLYGVYELTRDVQGNMVTR